MSEKGKKNNSIAIRNYYLNTITILPFLLLQLSGLIALRYHGGMDYSISTIGLTGFIWLLFHKILGLTSTVLVATHFWHHKYWFRTFFTKKGRGKNHDMNVALLIVFLLTVLTALFSWLVFDGEPADLIREIHNKLGFALIFLFIVHLVNHFKWMANMTKRVLGKK